MLASLVGATVVLVIFAYTHFAALIYLAAALPAAAFVAEFIADRRRIPRNWPRWTVDETCPPVFGVQAAPAVIVIGAWVCIVAALNVLRFWPEPGLGTWINGMVGMAILIAGIVHMRPLEHGWRESPAQSANPPEPSTEGADLSDSTEDNDERQAGAVVAFAAGSIWASVGIVYLFRMGPEFEWGPVRILLLGAGMMVLGMFLWRRANYTQNRRR